MSQSSKTEKKSKVGKIILLVTAILVIAALAGVVIYQQFQLRSGAQPGATPDVAQIQARVARHLLLPEEEAVVTTIDNAAEVKTQPFFSQVENGDQVLIFAAAAKIIIYRPSQDIIVNVGPIIDDRAAADLGAGAGGDPAAPDAAIAPVDSLDSATADSAADSTADSLTPATPLPTPTPTPATPAISPDNESASAGDTAESI